MHLYREDSSDEYRLEHKRNLGLEEASDAVRERVNVCRQLQLVRQATANAHIDSSELLDICLLNVKARKTIKSAVRELKLTRRTEHRLISIARTIADLAQCEQVESAHVLEALMYRRI